MKKLLICLLCVNFVTFISASSSEADFTVSEGVFSTDYSTSTASSGLINNVVRNPEITDIEEDTLEKPELVISDNSDIELQLDEVKSRNIGEVNGEKIKNYSAPEYPDLKEIVEPDIITLEPENNENKEELVNVELPPLGDSENTTEIVLEKTEEESKEVSIEPSLEPSQKDPLEKTELKPKKEHKVDISQEPVKQPEIENFKEPEEIETVTEEVLEPVVDVIKPSRSVTLKRREYVDVTYPGTGWIYTGIVDGSKDLSYFGRALGTKDTTFTLQAIVPGTKLLHFCKNDYLTGEYIDDYIEIVVLPDEGSNKTRVKAPDYKQPEPEVFETFVKKSAETETVLAEKTDIDISENEKNVAEITENKISTENINFEESLKAETIKPENINKPEKTAVAKKENAENKDVPKTENEVIVKETENIEKNYDDSQKNNTFTEKEIPKVSYIKPDNKPEPVKNIPEAVNTDNYDITLDFEEDGISIPEEEVIETSENSDVTDCNTLLKEANFLYNEKEFEAAYEKVNKYLEFATTDIDKGLLLKGQILEARSDFQDIKGAIEVYNTLMKEYPASIHWDEANKRVIYLKRFYLEVR